jgi:autotransporter-associated beta strand protein
MTCLMATWLPGPLAQGAIFTWNQTGAGPFTWSTAGNWTGGVPANAPGDVINLTANLTAAQIINLDVNATVGTLNIGDPTTAFFGYTLQSSNASMLTFDNGSLGATLAKAAAATATDVISAGIVLNDNLAISNLNANLTGQLILSGSITETGGPRNITVSGVAASSNGVTVLAGNNSFTGSVTINSGTLAAVGADSLYSGGANELFLAGGALALRDNGSGYGERQNIAFGDNVTITGNSTISVDRTGVAGFPGSTALNKTIQLNDLTIGTNTLTVANANGYGLEFTGLTTLSAATPTFSVSGGTASNLVQGLVLAGQVTGSSGFTKVGNGSLLLENASNDFIGGITVTAGVLAATSDGALGDAANAITLNGTSATFRAADNITTSRTINFSNTTAANNVLEVVQGKTLQLNAAFGTTANGFVKADNGIVDINVANGTFTGTTTINAGAIRLSNAAGLGTSVISISPGAAAPGAALQLNGVSIGNTVNLQGTNNVAFGGINFGGQLQAVGSGTSTTTGQLQVLFDAAIGADNGATLNINGGIHNTTTSGRALIFNAQGNGIINVNSNITSATTTANQYFAVRKYGAGTLNFTTASSVIPTDAATGLQIFQGTLALSDSGTLTGGNTIAIQVLPGATLTIDNTAAAIANRLGARPITLAGGNLNLIGNAAATNETFGTWTLARGQSNVSVTAGAGGANLTFGSFATNNPQNWATVRFSGTNLGAAAGAGNTATIKGNVTFRGADSSVRHQQRHSSLGTCRGYHDLRHRFRHSQLGHRRDSSPDSC